MNNSPFFIIQQSLNTTKIKVSERTSQNDILCPVK